MTTKRIIYSTPQGGVAIIIPTDELSIEQIAKKDVPVGLKYEFIDSDLIPQDRTFRDAWVKGDRCINHDLDKCKSIGHNIRRQKRSEEFAPLDEIIAKKIPGQSLTDVEAKRQEIRDRYSRIQTNIDAANSPEEIKATLSI
jgi:hypothetical protein